MTRYLISFDEHAMDHIPDSEIPAVSDAAHAVVREAQDAGVWVFGGGLDGDPAPVIVAGDGTVTSGRHPVGGLSIVDVGSREEALRWAAKLAVACRCPQDVNAFMPDPAVGN
jgi:hypothetical protein